MTQRQATWISYLLHPALFPLLGVFAILKLSPQSYSSEIVVMTLAMVFSGTYVIPVAISVLLFKLKVVDSLKMSHSRERRLPYAFGAISFYFTALLVGQIELLREPYLFLLAASALIVLHLVLLIWMKPSAHMAGIAAFLGLLIAISLRYAVNLLPLIGLVIILSGLVASARLRLQAHTTQELVVGFFSGLVLVFAIIYMA